MIVKHTIACAACLLVATSSHAAPEAHHYSGPYITTTFSNQLLVTSGTGSYATQYLGFNVTKLEYDLVVDPAALTAVFTSARFEYAAATIQQTTEFTVGFGPAITVLTTINFESGSFTFFDPSIRALTPGVGGIFNIGAGEAGSQSVSGHFSGTFSIQGPTETVSGSFSVSDFTSQLVLPNKLDTSLYPSELRLIDDSASGVMGAHFVNENFIIGTVDGITINTGISAFDLLGRYNLTLSAGSLASIPEPAHIGLLTALGSLAAGLCRRRRP